MSVNIHQLVEKLNTLPSKIRDANDEFIEAKANTERAKIELKLALATALISSKGANAGEKQARATLLTEAEQLNLIEFQKTESLKESQAQYLKNRFDSIKKIANLEQEQMRLNISGN